MEVLSHKEQERQEFQGRLRRGVWGATPVFLLHLLYYLLKSKTVNPVKNRTELNEQHG